MVSLNSKNPARRDPRQKQSQRPGRRQGLSQNPGQGRGSSKNESRAPSQNKSHGQSQNQSRGPGPNRREGLSPQNRGRRLDSSPSNRSGQGSNLPKRRLGASLQDRAKDSSFQDRGQSQKGQPQRQFHNNQFHNKGVEHLRITENQAGQRLDNFLITHFKGVPKTRLYRCMRKGEVRINKGRAKPEQRLLAGDILRLPPLDQKLGFQPQMHAAKLPAAIKNLLSEILYEDEAVIVINKPSGMACHGGSGLSFGVIEALRQISKQYAELELVHRLDKETSGCLILAKRKSALRALHEQFQETKVQKRYLALVKGVWLGQTNVEAPLLKNQLRSGERVVGVDDAGRKAKTHFRSQQKFERATLMEVSPLTGKTHQIRVHAAFQGHPIAGDEKYGDKEFNAWMKSLGLKRLFLHAKQLNFISPGTGQPVTVVAPLNPALIQLLTEMSGEKLHV